jgi:hypothetical protein
MDGALRGILSGLGHVRGGLAMALRCCCVVFVFASHVVAKLRGGAAMPCHVAAGVVLCRRVRNGITGPGCAMMRIRR